MYDWLLWLDDDWLLWLHDVTLVTVTNTGYCDYMM